MILEEIIESNRSHLDIVKLNNLSREVIEKIFSNNRKEYISIGFKERYLFSNAYTPYGFIDYTDTLLEGVGNIYYIEGDIGTGKSILLNRILEASKLRNYTTEVYYNAFMPNKIESIFIKDIDSFITSNINGKKLSKEKIDLNQFLFKEKNKEDYKNYEILLNEGIKSLNEAKENHFSLEQSYVNSVNFDKVTEVKEKILEEIKLYV